MSIYDILENKHHKTNIFMQDLWPEVHTEEDLFTIFAKLNIYFLLFEIQLFEML